MPTLTELFLNKPPIPVPAERINAPKLICEAALKSNIIDQLMPGPLKNETSENIVCALSGWPILPNEPMGINANRTNVGSTFHDEPDLVDRTSNVVNEWSLNLLRGEFLKAPGNAVITEEGFFKFSTARDIAWWLLNPPTTPFIMAKKTILNPQHVLWKAPVNLSNQIFFMQQGNNLLKINRANVFKTLDILSSTQNYRGKIEENPEEKKTKKDNDIAPVHPFFSLDSFSKDAMNFAVDHPTLNAIGVKMLQDFGNLSIGDIFMVGIVISAQRRPEDWEEVLNRTTPAQF